MILCYFAKSLHPRFGRDAKPPNDRDHPVAAKKLTIRKRLIRDLGASHCSSDFDISGKQS